MPLLELIDHRTLLSWAALFYALAFGFALLYLLLGRRYPGTPLTALIALGFILQTLGLYRIGMENGSCPLSSPFELVQFVSWSAILLYLIVGPAYRMSLLGFFSAGLAAGFSLFSLFTPGWDTPPPQEERSILPWIEAHASIALFSYGVFAMLALTSAMYLLQTYGLQHRRFEPLFRFLPSIVQTDRISRRLLWIGVAVLTLSLSLVLIYGQDSLGSISYFKLIATSAVWLSATLVLVLHLSRRLLTAQFAWVCIGLFILALFSLWPIGDPNSAPSLAL